MNSKDKFIHLMHTKLEHWNNKIDALVAKLDQAEGQVSTEYHLQIKALYSKHDEARERLKELEQSSEDTWKDMKMGVEIALEDMNIGVDIACDAISKAITSAKSHFK